MTDLKKILSRLDSIDERLSNLEQKGCLLKSLPIDTATAVQVGDPAIVADDGVDVTTDRSGAPLEPVDAFYGINIPYLDYGNDILSKWGKKTLSSKEKSDQLLDLFKTVREEGFAVVRFWLFPTFWHSDYTDINQIRSSMEVLFSTASAAGVKLVPTITSFNAFDRDKDQHSRMNPIAFLQSRDGKTLMHELKNAFHTWHSVIEHVDLVNELEWAITDIPDADPNRSKLHTITAVQALELIGSLRKAIPDNVHFTCGSASLKWAEFYSTIGVDIADFHAYEGWSIDYFPPLEKGHDFKQSHKHLGMVMGETDVPIRYWEQYRDVYRAVFLWAEPKNYYDNPGRENQSLNTSKLRDFIRGLK